MFLQENQKVLCIPRSSFAIYKVSQSSPKKDFTGTQFVAALSSTRFNRCAMQWTYNAEGLISPESRYGIDDLILNLRGSILAPRFLAGQMGCHNGVVPCNQFKQFQVIATIPKRCHQIFVTFETMASKRNPFEKKSLEKLLTPTSLQLFS